MFTLLDSTASHFANAANVDRLGPVPPADPMNTVAAAEVVVVTVEAAEVVADAFFVAEETADLAVAAEYVEAAAAEEAAAPNAAEVEAAEVVDEALAQMQADDRFVAQDDDTNALMAVALQAVEG